MVYRGNLFVKHIEALSTWEVEIFDDLKCSQGQVQYDAVDKGELSESAEIQDGDM